MYLYFIQIVVQKYFMLERKKQTIGLIDRMGIGAIAIFFRVLFS